MVPTAAAHVVAVAIEVVVFEEELVRVEAVIGGEEVVAGALMRRTR